jgi:hypothetical protein
MCNNDEREGGKCSCDDPQSIRHAHALFFLIHLYSFG